MLTTTKQLLSDGGVIELDENHLMNYKQLRLSLRPIAIGGDAVITVGHGKTVYSASYLEITATHLRIFFYSTTPELRYEIPHGLTVTDNLTVTIKQGAFLADITLESGGTSFVTEGREWHGRNGKIFASVSGVSATDVTLSWTSGAYSRDIWLFGDSYFNLGASERWTYHLYRDGYTDYLLSGYPGRNTAAALADFKRALAYGTPRIAVWCMGMNDGDADADVNASYLASTEAFLKICKEKGIIPVLSTIPNTPTVNNTHKNAYVRSLGYRYIDFASAVGATEKGSLWYDGMLSADNVHPQEGGAIALYKQAVADFPEILK